MSTTARYVNWFDESLDSFYGEANDGYIHGVYIYENEDDPFPMEVLWFKTEAEAKAELLNI